MACTTMAHVNGHRLFRLARVCMADGVALAVLARIVVVVLVLVVVARPAAVARVIANAIERDRIRHSQALSTKPNANAYTRARVCSPSPQMSFGGEGPTRNHTR